MGATPTERRLLVERDAAQKDRLAVEQDLGAPGLERAKPDALLDPIGLGGQDHPVAPRVLG